MKHKSLLSALVLTLVLILSTTSSFAADESIKTILDIGSTESQVIEPKGQFNDYYYTKKDVKTSYEWSNGKRVSDDLTSGPKGGSITSTKSATFSGSVSGDVFGLTFTGETTIKSSVGYTLFTEPNKTQYMAYRVQYKVERGVREKRSMMTGKVVSTNSYTVKRIDHGQYYLVTVK